VMVSITICTYNNAGKLALALESLRRLECRPSLEYEILVIDNNSRDETIEVVKRFQGILGHRLRYVQEIAQGLSHARNRALKEARGEIVSYIDDDVQVDPGWLAAVAAAFERYSPAVVGGKSYLIYPGRRPAWVPEEFEFLLSKVDYGDQVIVDTNKDLYGLNFSVRKELAVQVGGFDPSLGRCGRSLRSGEESDLQRRICGVGRIAVYEPRAIVGHIVSPDRMKKRWWVRRLLAAGRENVVVAEKGGRPLPSVFEALVHLIRCCGSIPKSLVLGDFSFKTFFCKSLMAVYALAQFHARVRLAWRRGLENSHQGTVCPR
jgi:glycosyltransferase involved in cell wall biosynthesis